MDNNIIKILKDGGIGVLPTDTIYGLVGSALSKEAVEIIYHLKNRTPDKPLIILISSLTDLELFHIRLPEKVKKLLEEIWPNPLSIVLPCLEEKFVYLHRWTQTLAFRMPDDQKLLRMLTQTGPIVAPSANPEGEPPAENIKQAENYFGDKVDFYLDGGELSSKPSTLIKIDGEKITVLREGAFRISNLADHGTQDWE